MSEGWVQVDNTIVRSTSLSVYEKAVYAIIKSHMNSAGAAWPSLPTIALEANCSRMQVVRALKALIVAGLIAKVSRGNGRVNTYYTSTPQVLLSEQPVPASDYTSTPQVLGSTPQVLQPVPASYPKKIHRRRTKKKTKEEEARVISPENHAELLKIFAPIWGRDGVEERIAECLAYPFARTKNRDWYLTTRKWLRDDSERQGRRDDGQHPNNPRKPQQAPRPGDLAYYTDPILFQKPP